jgi:hypothetical protein
MRWPGSRLTNASNRWVLSNVCRRPTRLTVGRRRSSATPPAGRGRSADDRMGDVEHDDHKTDHAGVDVLVQERERLRSCTRVPSRIAPSAKRRPSVCVMPRASDLECAAGQGLDLEPTPCATLGA